MKFSKLDQVVKDELDSSAITMYEITEYTDKDVREMFRRLNSGKPLNTSQKLTPDMSDELSDAIFDIISLPFFEKRLTSAQLKSSVDQSAALEILMFCNTNKDNDFALFTEKGSCLLYTSTVNGYYCHAKLRNRKIHIAD